MAYVTRSQVEDEIPPQVLIDGLDDDGDGSEDTGRFDSIVATASQEVDGYLSGRYTVPFAAPVPAKVCAAALLFTIEKIYSRRETKMNEGLIKKVKDMRDDLRKIGNGELPLDAATDPAFAPGAAVTDPVSINAQMT